MRKTTAERTKTCRGERRARCAAFVAAAVDRTGAPATAGRASRFPLRAPAGAGYGGFCRGKIGVRVSEEVCR